MDEQYATNARKSAIRMAWVAVCLQNFASSILRHAFAGKPMDDEAVRALKAECIADFKNPDAVGVPIEEEAEIMRKGLHDLEQMIDAAIAQARQG